MFEVFFAVKFAAGGVQFEEHILHDVLGVLGLAAGVERHAPDHIPVALHGGAVFFFLQGSCPSLRIVLKGPFT